MSEGTALYRKPLQDEHVHTKTQTLKRSLFGRPKLRVAKSEDFLITGLAVLFISITIYTVFFRIAYKWDYFQADTAWKIASNFMRVDLVKQSVLLEMMISLVATLALGFVTTMLGLFGGLAFGLLAARNLTKGVLPMAIRWIASVARAVPTIIWVLIVVAGYGLTSTTAIMGMFFHTIAFFVKSFAEAFEEVDEGTLEALKASGANWIQIVFGAVLPASMTKVISWIAIRSEINFGVAVVIGPAAGVPGTIGTLINNAARGGDYAAQGFGVLLVFFTAFIMEVGINKIRQKSLQS